MIVHRFPWIEDRVEEPGLPDAASLLHSSIQSMTIFLMAQFALETDVLKMLSSRQNQSEKKLIIFFPAFDLASILMYQFVLGAWMLLLP